MASSAYIFTTLERFSDGSTTSLTTWLKKFERCCVVGNKTDTPACKIKGQLLLLFVEERAKAILEEFEETRGGIPLDFATLSAKLKEHFEDVSGRENGMMIFESRVKQLNESVEEFMQALVSLYSDANPTHAAEIKLEAVKRKFLQGISPELRKTISVFCNNPFVTREQLLQHCRQAKTHLMEQVHTVHIHTITRRKY